MASRRAKPRIWYSAETDFIGAIAINSVDKFLELVLANPEVLDVLMGENVNFGRADVYRRIMELGITTVAVPTLYLKFEKWKPEKIFSIDMEDTPGKGYTKVLGLHL